MAFARSRILQSLNRTQFSINPDSFNAAKYGHKYTSEIIEEGHAKGRAFSNRIPKYKPFHPEIRDKMDAQKSTLMLFMIGSTVCMYYLIKDRQRDDQEFWYGIFKDKGFIGRYSYKQRTVEHSGLVPVPFRY